MILRQELAARAVHFDLVEFISQTFELQGGSCSEHYLDSAGEYMEGLYGLMLDMFVPDECGCLLCAAEKYVHNLLCFRRVKSEAQDIPDNEFVHIVETA